MKTKDRFIEITLCLLVGVFGQISTKTAMSSPLHLHYLKPQDAQVTGREILRQVVKAVGGDEVLQTIKNFRIKTRSRIFQTHKETILTVTETITRSNKTKQVMDLTIGTRTQVLNGNKSWKQLNTDVSPLTALEKREMERGLFRDLLLFFQRAESEELVITYLNETRIATETLYVVRIQNKIGDFFSLYIDSESYLVKKKTYHGAAEVGLATLEEIYSDYRRISGIMIPYQTIVQANGQKFIESKVIEVKYNLKLGEDFFLVPVNRHHNQQAQ